MPRLAIINMLIGFALIFLAACGGAFIAVNTTQRFIAGASQASWHDVLQAASHGHTSLFGLIHIVLGLTLPYSALGLRAKRIQTLSLFCGAMAMGPAMILRSFLGPSPSFEWTGVLMGSLLSVALAAIGMHIFGLTLKLARREIL